VASVACLLLLASNTARLLHAGDPVPVQAARRLLLGGASATLWLASITGPLSHEACLPALGWGCRPRAQLVPASRLVLAIVERSAFLGKQTCSACLDPRLPEPVLPSALSPSGVRVAGRRARGPRPRPCPPGCSFGSDRAGHRRRDLEPGATARSGKPSSEGALDPAAALWQQLPDPAARSGKPSSEGGPGHAVARWKTLLPGQL
jgi:hypothetical protein